MVESRHLHSVWAFLWLFVETFPSLFTSFWEFFLLLLIGLGELSQSNNMICFNSANQNTDLVNLIFHLKLFFVARFFALLFSGTRLGVCDMSNEFQFAFWLRLRDDERRLFFLSFKSFFFFLSR